jgi:hypothetical protein
VKAHPAPTIGCCAEAQWIVNVARILQERHEHCQRPFQARKRLDCTGLSWPSENSSPKLDKPCACPSTTPIGPTPIANDSWQPVPAGKGPSPPQDHFDTMARKIKDPHTLREEITEDQVEPGHGAPREIHFSRFRTRQGRRPGHQRPIFFSDDCRLEANGDACGTELPFRDRIRNLFPPRRLSAVIHRQAGDNFPRHPSAGS